MLMVTKRSGKQEAFSLDKIKATLTVSGDEANQPLNKSDLQHMLNEIESIVHGKETITSKQIATIIAGVLYIKGYQGVLKQYISYKNK